MPSEDWMGAAAFDRPEDHWPRKWAEAYLAFAAGEKRAWLAAHTLKFRHRVNELTVQGGVVDGARGDILEPSTVKRGQPSPRVVGAFALRAQKEQRLMWQFQIDAAASQEHLGRLHAWAFDNVAA